MKRLSLVLTLVLALAASGTAASGAAPDSPGAGTVDAAQKKKKTVNGRYGYEAESGGQNIVKFSRKGTRISFTYTFFKGSGTGGEDSCSERKVTFSDLRLKPFSKEFKHVKVFASKDMTLPGDGSGPDGGGGVASVEGRVNMRTLDLLEPTPPSG